MWLIRAALRRPITILVTVIAVALIAVFAVSRMRADIFPDLDLPVTYVAQPYGGMSPAQMEGYITYYYEYHFLYVNGIESVESKSIQNTSLLKLTFHAGTDMAEALAQTIGYVNRARAFMPPGTVGPFIMRFDAGTVPVGYLVFSSESRSLGEIQDLALNRVRPQFATLPGLTSPPPFGGSQRTIVIRVDPDRLRSYGMSPEEVIRAASTGNVIMPSGSVNVGEETRISPMNSVVTDINDLLELPIRIGAGPPVSVRDIGTVSDSTDIPTAYALVPNSIITVTYYFEETLRRRFSERFPTAQFSFEPGDIVNRIMNFGTSTPVEVAITGPDFPASRTFAAKVREELGRIPALRDLQYGQALDYPAIQVDVNRQMAGQLGVTVDQVGRSFAAATSSSGFVAPNYWADPRTGIAFQVQVEVPQPRMTTLDDLRVIPVSGDRGSHALLGDVANIGNATIVGEYDRINGQRMVTLTANVAGQDLGRTLGQVDRAIARAGTPPRGTTVAVHGQIGAMRETFTNISAGLVVAVVVIFLLLAANFQSLRLAFVVVSTVPAVLMGVVLMLAVTRTTLNVQSFMGAIMAIGVAGANAILLVTIAEQSRVHGTSPVQTAIDAARSRMRPVLMTSAAMIAGMIPMAHALGEGAEATAPLGRAVIGGLAAATVATLIVLPSVYALVQQSARIGSPSMDPDDPASAYRRQGTA